MDKLWLADQRNNFTHVWLGELESLLALLTGMQMTERRLAASSKAQHRHQKLHPWSSPKVRASSSWGCCCLSSLRVWSGEQHLVLHSLALMSLPSPSRRGCLEWKEITLHKTQGPE